MDKKLKHVSTSSDVGFELTYGSAAVSRVLRPAPTTNMLPQKPPKDLLTPLGQKSRHPTARTARPDQISNQYHTIY
jgi:hypothetical protein